jgi:hypothetical protein
LVTPLTSQEKSSKTTTAVSLADNSKASLGGGIECSGRWDKLTWMLSRGLPQLPIFQTLQRYKTTRVGVNDAIHAGVRKLAVMIYIGI